jgi:rhodanese-related sulfurtransferase
MLSQVKPSSRSYNMAVETKPALDAATYFEAKLAFEIGPVELKMGLEKGEKYQIIDLRTTELFAKGHIPGAHQSLYDNLEAKLTHLSKEVTTVVYCYDELCYLSAKAALFLAKKGYKVRELSGGWDGWVERKFAVEGESTTSSCSSSCG